MTAFTTTPICNLRTRDWGPSKKEDGRPNGGETRGGWTYETAYRFRRLDGARTEISTRKEDVDIPLANLFQTWDCSMAISRLILWCGPRRGFLHLFLPLKEILPFSSCSPKNPVSVCPVPEIFRWKFRIRRHPSQQWLLLPCQATRCSIEGSCHQEEVD
jgi:hypothetical protein